VSAKTDPPGRGNPPKWMLVDDCGIKLFNISGPILKATVFVRTHLSTCK
jgi:hypothetical protein